MAERRSTWVNPELAKLHESIGKLLDAHADAEKTSGGGGVGQERSVKAAKEKVRQDVNAMNDSPLRRPTGRMATEMRSEALGSGRCYYELVQRTIRGGDDKPSRDELREALNCFVQALDPTSPILLPWKIDKDSDIENRLLKRLRRTRRNLYEDDITEAGDGEAVASDEDAAVEDEDSDMSV